jgi:hypothetical protein
MGRRAKIARDLFVAFRTFFRTDIFRARNPRRRDNAATAVQTFTGKKNDADCEGDSRAPKQFFAPLMDPGR